ncbi:amphiregulin [Phodopus roborovskii]|uniref:Areg protein n=1 Tax=Phodopus roborovskii TaxID=109678 RepID=A0AAU9ZVK2_PHORO|nr:amphiregulin [Phodopus roborovskii]CAH6884773.1 Areg [Phodopus roborovskii]
MRTPLLPRALPVLSLLLILGSGHHAAGLAINDTSEKSEAFSGDHNATGLVVSVASEVSAISEMPSGSELSTGDYDYSEEYDNEPQISGYVIDDSVRVEQVIKPKKNKTEGDKTSDKPKRKKKGGKSGKGRRNKKKKKNPCDTEFQNFCIHGECKYIENLEAVTCKCHPDYFGERCGEKSMKTHSGDDNDLSKIAAITVFVSAVILIAVGILVTVQLRKRYFKEYEGEAEERKKLRQETGNVPVIA